MRLLSIILLGEKSLAQLREATAPSIQNMKIDLIFVSPLTRALQTCLGIFEQAALAQVNLHNYHIILWFDFSLLQ
jgi:broad specificity phosphatase PhoE